MFVTALSQPALTVKIPDSLAPIPITFTNFIDVAKQPDIIRWTINSFIVSITVTLLYTYLCGMSGYIFAKYDFKWKKIIFSSYIFSMAIPLQLIMVPLYIICSKMGLNNTYAGLILPALSAPFGVFLMKQFMNSFPYELVEAAKIDGYSEFKIYNFIVIPLSIPGLSTLATFTFVNEWNSFLWPLIITDTTEMKVLQAGIAHLQASDPMRHTYLMAAAAYSAIPVILVFFVFQKYFLKGVNIEK